MVAPVFVVVFGVLVVFFCWSGLSDVSATILMFAEPDPDQGLSNLKHTFE
ncbi:hypothetical protein ABMA58_07780 [Oceanospirillum sp. HFRX-1_2]